MMNRTPGTSAIRREPYWSRQQWYRSYRLSSPDQYIFLRLRHHWRLRLRLLSPPAPEAALLGLVPRNGFLGRRRVYSESNTSGYVTSCAPGFRKMRDHPRVIEADRLGGI